MAAAEAEQTAIDKFWGMDEERGRMLEEVQLMQAEDKRSVVFETFVRTSTQINQWEEEEFLQQQKIGLKSSIVETMAQQNYLHAIYDGSLIDVSTYCWPTRPVVTAPETKKREKVASKQAGVVANDEARVGDSFLRSLYSVESQAGFPLEASTIHTEGRQRSQVLVANRSAETMLTGSAAASRILSKSFAATNTASTADGEGMDQKRNVSGNRVGELVTPFPPIVIISSHHSSSSSQRSQEDPRQA
jgi:hypothetical protein